MSDLLAPLTPVELSAFYRRLADAVDKNKGQLKTSMAALLMRQWLDNRNSSSTFEFDAPDHLKNRTPVIEALDFHRKVFLTQEKARFTGGIEKWAGVVPRLKGQAPFPKWDGKSPLSMDYESLVEMPLRYQLTGDDADKDILYGLRGFQLKSNVLLTAVAMPGNSKLKVMFQLFQAQVRDRYDWDYSEHLTVPNPDFNSKLPNAVAPTLQTIVVYHKHAKRLEDAGLAAPYDLRSKPWDVMDARLKMPAEIDPKAPT